MSSWGWNLSLIIIFAFVTLLLPLSQSIPLDSDGIQSNGNSDAVEWLKKPMDESANPCEDFYKYSCGNWPEHNPRIPGYPIWTNLYIINKSVRPNIELILKLSDSSGDNEAIRKARRVYRACMDENKINQAGMEPFRSVINENGGWPLITIGQEWEAKNLTWQKIHTNLMKTGIAEGLFSISVGTDPKNSTYNRLGLEPPDLLLTRKEFMDPNSKALLDAYKFFILQVVHEFQGSSLNPSPLDIIPQISDLVDFEKALAEISDEEFRVDEVDKWYHLMSIEELQNFYDNATNVHAMNQINWLETCRQIFSINPEITIDSSEQLIVPGTNYLIKLSELLAKTPPRTIVNYIMWKAIASLTPHGTDQLRDLVINFNDKRDGAEPIGDRECVTSAPMDRAISLAFVQKYSSPESRQAISEMMMNMKQAMKQHIHQSSWMDEDTKNLAVEKIDAIREYIGYPDHYTAESIDDYYREFEPSDSYFENALKSRQFAMKNSLKGFRKPIDRREWPVSPTKVNAYYVLVMNSIFIPAGILQPPLYDSNRPSIFNYAMIGSILGHEISHALDNHGRRFDKNGNAVTWWKQSSIDKYEQQAQCFINQFNNYTIIGDGENILHVNGNLTLEENISDTIGLKVARGAYEIYKNKHEINGTRIAGLEEFSDDQLFFLAFGNLWCAYENDMYLRDYSPFDKHSPAKPRVNGAVSNNNEFSRAFNCPIDSPANPTNKCDI